MMNGRVPPSSPSPKALAAIGAVARMLALTSALAAVLSACTPAPPTSASTSIPPATRTPLVTAEALAPEVVVYASDLTESALTDELAFWDDPASPGGKMIGIPNTGDELDPPPENDPSVTFQVDVQQGIPYRCWIHMKVGAPKGRSQANMIWAQFSHAVDEKNQTILKPRSGSYLTARGPAQEGWAWAPCDPGDGSSAGLVRFGKSGLVTVRLQAGMEGVGFDQFLLSPARFLEKAPAEEIVAR